MIIISNYHLEYENDSDCFHVHNHDFPECPFCSSELKVIGSRLRKVIQHDGSFLRLMIRRLRCAECRNIHHELPDFVIPYKHYGLEAVEKILMAFNQKEPSTSEAVDDFTQWQKEKQPDYPCEYSTALRLSRWFSCLIAYLANIPCIYSEICISPVENYFRSGTLINCKSGWMKAMFSIVFSQT